MHQLCGVTITVELAGLRTYSGLSLSRTFDMKVDSAQPSYGKSADDQVSGRRVLVSRPTAVQKKFGERDLGGAR